MATIQIQAIDTLFFRDGKPFSMNEETWADGIFPPSPRVIYGALRTSYLAEYSEFSKANTEEDPTSALKISAFGLYLDSNVLYPIPLDVYKEKEKKKGYLLALYDKENKFWDGNPFSKILNSPKEQEDKILEPIENGFFTKVDLVEYLENTQKEFCYSDLSKFYTIEPKIGIARDRESKTSSEGKLYRVNLVRPASIAGNGNSYQSLEFIVEYQDLELPKNGFLKLGAESKIANYNTVVEDILKIQLDTEKYKEAKRFKLYLSTPAYFEKGSLPKWINENSLEGEFKSLKLKLLTAAVGKPILIGGFDLKQKRPKPMRRFVPAGSVYYFEILDGSFEEAYKVFHGNSISEESQKEGFGISFIGMIE